MTIYVILNKGNIDGAYVEYDTDVEPVVVILNKDIEIPEISEKIKELEEDGNQIEVYY